MAMFSHPRRILIIDDEPDILEFLSYNFRKNGYEVYTALDGIMGFHIAQNQALDIIITDVLMPNMNGIIFCQQIKAMERFKDLPIIFLSATKDAYQMENAIKAGAIHFFSKPIRIAEIIEYADKLMESKKSAEQLLNL